MFVQILQINENIPRCAFFETDSRARKEFTLKNKIKFCYLPTHFFNQVTCWLSPSGVNSTHNFTEGSFFSVSWSVRSLILIRELAYMTQTEGPWAAQRTTSGTNPECSVKGPKFVEEITTRLRLATLKHS